MKTQEQMILNHLKIGPITPLEALNRYGCMRLAAVIFNLKSDGHNIHSGTARGANGKKWAVYRLLGSPKSCAQINETLENMKRWEKEREVQNAN